MTVSPKFGLVHHMMTQDGMTKEKFAGFHIEVSSLLLEEGNVTLIFDYAPSHRELPRLLSDAHDCVNLPRYSPFLNMTDMVISCVKATANASYPSLRYRWTSAVIPWLQNSGSVGSVGSTDISWIS